MSAGQDHHYFLESSQRSFRDDGILESCVCAGWSAPDTLWNDSLVGERWHGTYRITGVACKWELGGVSLREEKYGLIETEKFAKYIFFCDLSITGMCSSAPI